MCAGIIGPASLRLDEAVQSVLEAQIRAGEPSVPGHPGLIRLGSRYGNRACSGCPEVVLRDPTFRKGFACLGPLGLSFDAWLFHPRFPSLPTWPAPSRSRGSCSTIAARPSASGGSQAEEEFPIRKAAIEEPAQSPNLVVKLGGLGMCLLGTEFHLRPRPPTSGEIAEAWRL
jgi:hypothetical protein